MKWRRTISLGLAAAMTASTVLAGCGGDSGANGNASSGDNKNQTAATEEGGSQASGDVTTIEVYDVAANYQGMQAGWFGDLVKEKFGLELNIFAPNTSGDAAALYQTRCTLPASRQAGTFFCQPRHRCAVSGSYPMDCADGQWYSLRLQRCV